MNPALRRFLSGLALAGTAIAPALAAPDETGYGAARGYPVGNRQTWFTPEYLVGSFSAMERIFPMRAVPAGTAVRELPPHPATVDWPFISSYLDSHPATGLMVLKDGQVLLERYQYGRTAEHRFTSFSMAKTLVGMAVGVAIAEGRIASVEDPVDKYLPALASSGWSGVAIRHVLNMSSGVRFDETYDRADSDIARLSRAWSAQRGSLMTSLQGFTARDAPAGERFHYASADTQVLGQLLVQVTGMPLADYISRNIWQPMGAEADAAWVTDPAGMEAAYCCLSARLRDWARLGLLLMEHGQREGRSAIPRAWVEAATTVRAGDQHLSPRRATPYEGYGYQTWILPDGLGFALFGVRGQAVFVHPRLKLVMVQTAVWTESVDRRLGRQRNDLWRQLVRAAETL